jgi:Mn-dependent DtxR family transcriptional regulator
VTDNDESRRTRGRLRVAEVAREIGVSASTVRRMIADGELDGYRLRQPSSKAQNTPLYVTRASFDLYLQKVKASTNE